MLIQWLYRREMILRDDWIVVNNFKSKSQNRYCLELALHGCLRGNHHHLATQIICEIEEGFGITSTYAEKVLIKISLRRNALTSADSSIRRLLSEDETCVDSSIFVPDYIFIFHVSKN